jgi:hypothetical protein
MGKEEIVRLCQEGKNTFAVTISTINSGIRKLVQYTKFDQENSILYRDTCNMKISHQVFQDKSFVEYGLSRVTPLREVTLQYSGNQHSTIFEIEGGQIDCDTTISWVSQYPGEGEHIILPDTIVELSGRFPSYFQYIPLGLEISQGSDPDHVETLVNRNSSTGCVGTSVTNTCDHTVTYVERESGSRRSVALSCASGFVESGIRLEEEGKK